MRLDPPYASRGRRVDGHDDDDDDSAAASSANNRTRAPNRPVSAPSSMLIAT